MSVPGKCGGCDGRELTLADDGVFRFIVCRRCGRIGPSATEPEDAIELWNRCSDAFFMYDKGPEPSIPVREYAGGERRRSERYVVEIRAVMRLYPFTGAPVPVVVKNLSMYGAYLEVAEQGLDVWQVPDGTLPYFELEMTPSEAGFPAVFPCNASHVSVKPPRIAVGTSFVQQDGRHLYVLRQLLRDAPLLPRAS
ncbi:hypothetical protein Dde_2972 [Oleidesulfovibrio alaskensis G20]|jgi:hypothetical protein|uniref:Uncharacterized protein n=1 Tax=Oleidesulfovibrio alaskensis (strain ATCC BAA-1058 / DSM 17464 / G20) TaxID=207559 RepID=Q30X30_OLEA2|nr:hypothetical protein [Oleidesulfovibrio alaskensis]ABB39766.1 hypothetical protein Dde_2972 [Oleidesulfovibrio alaskensis G20]MBG0774375.1 hypothetical protein [Oleidesulfovibrio alaskensis]